MSSHGLQLANHIKALQASSGFDIVTTMDGNYGHMGATLADAILQAGVKYETVVRPRVQRLLKEPQAKTTSGFSEFVASDGGQRVLNWNGERKLRTLTDLTAFLIRENIETEDAFRDWIDLPGNMERLREIKGIKDKTSNYLRILLWLPDVAVDRHLFRFLAEAGLETNDYGTAAAWISEAADLLGTPRALLDHSIWRHMSERKKKSRKANEESCASSS